jgi:hypothetical protein
VKRDKPRNLPASVSDRLRMLAHQRQEENQNLLNRYGLERWLYRMSRMVDIGLSNTRLKDYFDIRTLARQFEFEGEILAAAIKATFERRQTPLPSSLPAALGSQFAADSARLKQWNAFLKKNNLPTTDVSLEETVKLIGEFLMPPVSAVNRGENFETTWYPGGYWQSKSPAKEKT